MTLECSAYSENAQFCLSLRCSFFCGRTILWEDVGAVRRTSSLREGAQLLSELADRSGRLYETSALSPETVELRNGAQTGAMIAAAASNNACSIGTHFMEDAGEDIEEEQDLQQGQAI